MSNYKKEYNKTFDEFFLKQPNTDFVDEVKEPIHKEIPENFGKRAKEENEININGMYLDIIRQTTEKTTIFRWVCVLYICYVNSLSSFQH